MKTFIALTAAFLALSGCSKAPTPATTAAPDLSAPIPEKYIAVAEQRDLSYSLDVTGDVTPDFQLEVKAEVGGKIKSLHVEPGQTVKAGDLLVEIDDKDLQTERASALTEIEGAKLSVEKMQRNFERARDLFTSKLISQEAYDNLSSDLRIAENGLERAQRRLDQITERLQKTRIVAPADGTVLEVKVIEGQVVISAASVNSGTTLATIADLSKLLVQTHVNQYDVAKLKEQQHVTITCESLQSAKMEAEVTFIAPIATSKNSIKGFAVEARILNPDRRLRPGMTVSLTIPIASTTQAVTVPISAVFKGSNDERIVYVRNGEETQKREVSLGMTNLDFAEIKSGVAPGEHVLLVEPRDASKRS